MDKWFGKVALVTGASVGIGAAIAQKLSEHGLKVVTCARNIEKLQQNVSKVKSEKGEIFPVQCDLRKEDDILSMFKFITEKFGTLNICINNAGLGHKAQLLDGKTEAWKEMLDVNVLALSIVTREAVSLMRKSGVDDGHVININSMSGHRVTGLHMYSATKFAVTALTEGLRRELREAKSRIRSTSISPGVVETEFAYRVNPNDPEKARSLYSSLDALRDVDIVEAVVFALSCPPRMDVNDIYIRPVEQSM